MSNSEIEWAGQKQERTPAMRLLRPVVLAKNQVLMIDQTGLPRRGGYD
jgi:hypothetical protein